MPIFTKIDGKHGQIDANSPADLKELGSKALAEGDVNRATHMYTLAIDMAVAQHGKEAPETQAAWMALDAASGGVVHALLSNRSLTLLKADDAMGAADDAEHCCLAKPDFAKGHLRLLAALSASKSPLDARRRACTRGLRACPSNKELQAARSFLDAEAKQAAAEAAAAAASEGGGAATAAAVPAASVGISMGMDDETDEAMQIAATRLVADDPADPRRAMAAGDVGSALAVGAYGLTRDVEEAERYLRIGADGGDAAAMRNLGLLLLETSPERAGEAAEHLRDAARRGDEDAAGALSSLSNEARQKQEQALFKLRAMASAGDARAVEMLKAFEAENQQQQQHAAAA